MNTDALRTQLVKKLQELFQMDQPDLDFGFYRVMHAKAAEISRFIDHDLLDTIKTAFDSAASAEAQETFAAARTKVVENFGASALDEHDNLQPAFAQTPAGKAYVEAQAKLNSAKDALTGEDSVYYHLYRFFSRYYDNGDFVSMRYHTRETAGMAKPYAIPYGGEEVMLHWANADQYYIKTAENFANYAFDLTKSKVFAGELVQTANTPLVVRFLVVEAQEGEHGNIKADAQKERKFFLAQEDPVQLNDAGELEIRFEYRQAADDDKVDEETAERIKAQFGASRKGDVPLLVLTDRIMSALKQYQATYTGIRAAKLTAFAEGLSHTAPTDSIRKRILLTRYLAQYTARNTADYFIHKDLRSFLRREMDFYIKNEIMNLDEVELAQSSSVENTLLLLKVFRKIAGKLIDFLGQLEDFQKKLWLKKKFVVQCDYCITLDRVPEEFYPEIFGNSDQWNEWARLGFFRIEFHPRLEQAAIKFDRPDMDDFLLFLKEGKLEKMKVAGRGDDLFTYYFVNSGPSGLFKSLMLDTKFFSEEFKSRLLAKIDNFDEQCDGVLVHSENFQALNLLQERYRGQVKCTYIDPPYNTGDGDFPYKDSFQHSSWASMFIDRLSLLKPLMNQQGLFACHMDEHEHLALEYLVQSVFGKDGDLGKLIWDKRNPKGEVAGIASQHEYIHWATSNREHLKDENAFVRDKTNAPAILAKAAQMVKKAAGVTDVIREEFSAWVKEKNNGFSNGERAYCFLDDNGDVYQPVSMAAPDKPETRSHRPLIHPITHKACPVPAKGWRFPDTTMDELLKKNEIIFGKDETTQPRRKYLLKENLTENVPSLYYMGGSDEVIFKNLHLQFDNPKPVEVGCYFIKAMTRGASPAIVLDFFAGSGTAAHSTISLNRQDQAGRKYVLVEMGDYFDTVLKPRIEKVVFSPDWKDGRPTSFDKGVSHCFKYLRLESYEDALNNLVVPEASVAPQGSSALREEYMLHYMLDTETRESLLQIRDFKQPFGHYRMQIKQPGSEAGELRSVDLQETFNYLLGLRVEQYYRQQGYQAAFKRSPDPELPASAQGQRTRLELDGRPELDDRGPWQFRKIEGWIPADLRNPNDGRKKRVLIIWRTLTDQLEQDNLMLDWYIGDTINLNEKHPEYDVIYVNGSNNLGADRKETDTYQVHLIEEEFLKQMWSGETV